MRLGWLGLALATKELAVLLYRSFWEYPFKELLGSAFFRVEYVVESVPLGP